NDNTQNPSLDDILAADQWARQEVFTATEKLANKPQIVSVG
ncbi:MAG: 1-deoxy-D-xylulose-5-phosphate reductoisomerase, partial [Sphaerospermopsis kisseleviana]